MFKTKNLVIMTAVGFLLISGMIFFFIMDLSSDLSGEASDIESTEDTKIEEVEEHSDQTEKKKEENMIKLEIGIQRQHEYWNDQLGFLEYKVFNADRKHDELKDRIKQTNELIDIANGTLKEDLISARSYIEKAIESDDIEDLKQAHRYFHDLDIGLNGASAKKFWGNTKTYGSERP